MTTKTYYAEVTDTFGGEANYCWLHKYLIRASSEIGALRKLGKHEGLAFRADGSDRWSAKGACICAFVRLAEEWDTEGVAL